MSALKQYVVANTAVYKTLLFCYYLFRPLSPFPLLKRFFGYFAYCAHLIAYFTSRDAEPFALLHMRPCVNDWTAATPVDTYYFYQDTWLFERILEQKPEYHVDIGSTALLVGILSKLTRVCSLDVRPLPVRLSNLECKKGDITRLPFHDREIPSLSSLCVIEHIGLGRYGDELDPLGSVKAVREVSRVLAEGGNVYVSVPIGKNGLFFNAYRVFAIETILSMFEGFTLMNALIILPGGNYSLEEFMAVDESIYADRTAVGCFHFQKHADDRPYPAHAPDRRSGTPWNHE